MTDASFAPLNINEITGSLIRNTAFTAVGKNPLEELEMECSNTQEILEIKYLLSQILAYPSSELAQLHHQCNRIGNLDLKSDHQNHMTMKEFEEAGSEVKFCPCCGFIKQEHSIKLCTSIKNLNNIGVSTYLYFETLINLIVLLSVAFLVFCVFALATNIMASDEYKIDYLDEIQKGNLIDDEKYRSFQNLLVLSLGSKQLHFSEKDRRYFIAQCWIGVGLLFLWGCYFIRIKFLEKVGSNNLSSETKSAADYSIVIENVPTEMTKQILQKELNDYQEAISGLPQHMRRELKIMRFNMAKPFYLDESMFQDERVLELNKKHQEMKEMFISWLEYRRQNGEFEVGKEERQKAYAEYEKIEQERVKLFIEITERIKKEIEENQEEPTTVAFVTFDSNLSKNLILELNEEDLADKIRYVLSCCRGKLNLYLKDENGIEVKAYIRQAPEPEDIIWSNLGQSKSERRKRKLITFISALLILGVSFVIIFGLSKAQIDYSSQSNNSYISFLISLVISVINVVIQQLLRKLTLMERNYTSTNQQASLGIKAVLALLTNSIVIPILVNKYFKDNIYGVNGLAYDVFLLGITNSFLSPILKVFDLYYWFTRLMSWLKDKPAAKLYLDQKELNQYSELIEFEVGYEYIYAVNLFLFTCFFMSLQPIIVLFAVAGLGMMYWAQKYSLYARCKRPVPGNKNVNNAMYSLIYLGPLFYGIGSFCWSHFLQDKNKYISIAPNLTACIIGAIIFIMPFKAIAGLFLGDEAEEQMKYEENRIFLPSEYDRLNPSTSKEAVKEYMEFVENFKKGLDGKSKKQIERIEKGLLMQVGRGKYSQDKQFQNILGTALGSSSIAHDNGNILAALMGTGDNVNNPLLFANTLLHDNGNPLNILVQNWGSEGQQDNPLFKMTESNLKMKKNEPEIGVIQLFDNLNQEPAKQEEQNLLPFLGNFANQPNRFIPVQYQQNPYAFHPPPNYGWRAPQQPFNPYYRG